MSFNCKKNKRSCSDIKIDAGQKKKIWSVIRKIKTRKWKEKKKVKKRIIGVGKVYNLANFIQFIKNCVTFRKIHTNTKTLIR